MEKTADWLVFSHITGPICARGCNSIEINQLDASGQHDWPVMGVIQEVEATPVLIFASGNNIPNPQGLALSVLQTS